MKIICLGLSHREAPVELRERLLFKQADLPEALSSLVTHVPEGAVLSTCLRTEVYAVVANESTGREALLGFLEERQKVPAVEFESRLYQYVQEDAVRHLMRVAAGLDSLVLGEPQVLGQVRDAYEVALRHQAIGRVLSRLFRHALEVGKRARTTTAISRKATSISTAAVELARREFGDLRHCTALVIGAGEMGRLAARTLADAGVARLLLTSRTRSRAERIALSASADAVGFEALPYALRQADLVISSTDAPGYIITAESVLEVMRQRHGRPLLLVDIAVPRDIQPEAGRVPGVRLYNIDHLEQVCHANLVARQQEAQKAERMVEEEAAKFMKWWESIEVLETISALVQKAESIRQKELARALGRLGQLGEQEKETISVMTEAIVRKMLHEPIIRLKQRGTQPEGPRYTALVRDLFGLHSAN